jgi:glyoxalase family protein
MSTNDRGRSIAGIHHVTAIAGAPQENLDFYTGVLGLRFVKNTVNFGDPGSYHLYYGDEVGHPGTILTFFAWPDAPPARLGRGVATATAFSVPETSLEDWMSRLAKEGYEFEAPRERLGDTVLALRDPGGLRVELVAHAGVGEGPDWEGGPVPAEQTTRGVHSVTLSAGDPDAAARLLLDVFGYGSAGEEETAEGRRFRFRSPSEAVGSVIDLVHGPDSTAGTMGVGAIHHVAFRTDDDEQQLAWRDELLSLGFDVTPVRDRHYFKSIYFREPGGVLFEIATDPPGFTRDETAAALGSEFKLPPWLEPERERIEGSLPPLRVRNGR